MSSVVNFASERRLKEQRPRRRELRARRRPGKGAVHHRRAVRVQHHEHAIFPFRVSSGHVPFDTDTIFFASYLSLVGLGYISRTSQQRFSLPPQPAGKPTSTSRGPALSSLVSEPAVAPPTVHGRRFVWRMGHRVRAHPSGCPCIGRSPLVLLWDPLGKDKKRLVPAKNGNTVAECLS